MPDWMVSAFSTDADLSTSRLFGRMIVAFVLGCVVSGIYRFTHGRGADQSRGLMATLVLLTVLIAMMTLVIGDNVARAFSLVGALAIVRFRTVVEDTRDTAFVIFAVSVGMAVGAGFMKVPLVAIPVAALAAFMFHPPMGMPWAAPLEFDLSIRIGAAHVVSPGPAAGAATGLATGLGASTEQEVQALLERHSDRVRLRRVATARQGAQVEHEHRVRLREGHSAAALLAALQLVDGVQGVELKAIERS